MKRPAVLSLIAAFMLLPSVATATTWHVPGDAPSIQAGIDLAAPGDDVLVAAGEYLEYNIVMKGGVWVHSEEGPEVTTVNANGSGTGFIFADLQQTAVLEGLTILNGHARGADQHDQSGGGLRCLDSRIMVRDCTVQGCIAEGGIAFGGGIYTWQSEAEIHSCTVAHCSADLIGGGIAAYHSTVTVNDCRVLDNTASAAGGGIYAMGPEVTIAGCIVSSNGASWGTGGGIVCTSNAFAIEDCLLTDNIAVVIGDGSALYVAGGAGSISGCTIAHNRGWYNTVSILDTDMEIDRCAIAFNSGAAFFCWSLDITSHCCDVYGNSQGDEICGEDLGGNFSADPLFCDAANSDFTLDACSPCLPGNHPDGVDCGLIGARGQGCGATAVESASWGQIKALYRQ